MIIVQILARSVTVISRPHQQDAKQHHQEGDHPDQKENRLGCLFRLQGDRRPLEVTDELLNLELLGQGCRLESHPFKLSGDCYAESVKNVDSVDKFRHLFNDVTFDFNIVIFNSIVLILWPIIDCFFKSQNAFTSVRAAVKVADRDILPDRLRVKTPNLDPREALR